MSDKNIPDQVDDFDDDVPAITEADKKRAAEQNQQVEQEAAAALGDPDDLDDNATISFASQPPRTNRAEAAAEEASQDASDAATSNDAVASEERADAKEATAKKPGSTKTSSKNLYDRLNRAQPQQIPAGKPITADKDFFEDSQAEASGYASGQFASEPTQEASAATEVFGSFNTTKASANTPVTAAPSASDYADQDFAAPAGAAPAGAAPTGVAPAGLGEPLAVGHPETTQIPQAEAEEPYDYEAIETHARGTIDFGLFLLRIFLGAWLILESIATLFAIGSREGRAALEAEYVLQGYAEPALLAVLVPSLQLAAGVFLVLGVLSPLASSVAVAVTGWNFLHVVSSTGDIDIWQLDSRLLVAWFIFLIAVAIQFTGPGRVSVDRSRSWTNRPLASSWLFFIIGLAGAVAMWWFAAGVNPLA